MPNNPQRLSRVPTGGHGYSQVDLANSTLNLFSTDFAEI